MKTSELIETARNFSKPDIVFDRDDSKSKVYAVLVNKLCDRLEMACSDMKYGIENVGCYVCAKEMPDGFCDVCKFVWRGDTE